MAQGLSTVIFDLGGVLIDWNPRYLYRKLLKSEAEVESFLGDICTSDWNEQQDAGRSLEEGTRLKVNEYPGHKALIEAYYGRWTEMLGGPIEGTVDILQQLKKQGTHKLLALTNWSAETFPHAWERYPFLHWFEDILVSGREKLKKPNPAIYHLLLSRHHLSPTETLFIDDNQRNIDSASGLGLQTIWYRDPDQLTSELQKLGILIG